MRLRIAARKSDLARIQAYSVGKALQGTHPGLQIEYQFRESLGDKNLHDPLWQMPERGVFTEDFYDGLVRGDCDLVVHSWKDLPVQERRDTEIFATMERADPRDLLLMPKRVADAIGAGKTLQVLSSSPRRKYNLEKFLPKALPFPGLSLAFVPVRGNIPTRIRKLFAGEGDALILAKAALDRILSAEGEEFRAVREEVRRFLADAYWMVLPLSQNPTAAAQGALAIEVARARQDIKSIIAKIHSAEYFEDICEERRILAGYGGGCHQKIGVNLVRGDFGRVLCLQGVTDQGQRLSAFRLQGAPAPEKSKGAKIFPTREEFSAFFDRKALAAEDPGTALFVAKAEALPEAWNVGFSRVVWTAGIKTWRRLAERGIWVNGTSDGLGESDPHIDLLVGEEISFTKLSHSRGTSGYFSKQLPTYELTEREQVPNLHGRTHFFWMSGSQFDVALRRFPEIAEGKHASGPGHTYHHIKKVLGDSASVSIHLSYEDWKEEIL